MTKRLDYNQIAPNGAKALGGVYGLAMSCRAVCPANWWSLFICGSRKSTTAPMSRHAHPRPHQERGEGREARAGASLEGRRQSLQRDRTRRACLGRECGRVAETGVPDSAYKAARDVFDEKQLVNLTIAISLVKSYNRMAISFRNTPQAVLEN
jgi:hypothetical protein